MKKPVVIGIALALAGVLGLFCVGIIWLAFLAGKGAEYTFSTEGRSRIVVAWKGRTGNGPSGSSGR